jgi:putative salt-induced outer membrane protein YdiY
MDRNKSAYLILAIVAAACFAGTLAGTALAQDAAWAPPEPSDNEKDWVRISSGEWITGNFDLLRDETLYFDSAEFDDVTIDWVDVAEFRCARVMTIVMNDALIVTGTASFRDDILKVDTGAGVREFQRAEIHSILEGQPSELNFWSARIGADLRLRSGNTEQDDFGARIFLKREAARSRIDIKYQGNFSKTQDIETVRNNRGNLEWKVFLSRKFFVNPVKFEYFDDKFQNIDRRITLGAGFGYYISRSSKADWFVDIGGAYQDTRYDSVEEGQDLEESNGSIPFRTTLETDLSKKIELTAEYGVQLGLGSGANTIHHTYILFEIEIWKDFDFDMSLTWDHVTHPKTNADGITPEKDDLSMYYGVSLNF